MSIGIIIARGFFIKNNINFRPRYAFSLVLRDFQFITPEIQAAEPVNQDFGLHTKVYHGPEVHIPAYARETIVVQYVHLPEVGL